MSGNQMEYDHTPCKRDRLLSIVFGITFLAVSCISPFEPDYHDADDVLVVDGSIIKGQETQTIRISRSSPITNPEYKPVGNCQVKVLDDSGNEFIFNEESPGDYRANIDDALLKYDAQYKLVFITPDGNNYESGYQRILKTPPVDSIYSIRELHYSSDLNQENLLGIQFYIDLNAGDDASRYYRWQLEETFEIQSDNEIWGYYDGQSIKLFANSDSLLHCWKTNQIKGLYSISTVNLNENCVKKIPFHFKLSSSIELMIKYCLTVKQYALNEDAYDYWHQKQVEMNESEGIYTSQPGRPKTNITNTGNPDELVVGFFWASSISQKRIFLKNPFFKTRNYGLECKFYSVTVNSFSPIEITSKLMDAILYYGYSLPEPPIYIVQKFPTFLIAGNMQCVDCRTIYNSDTKKPDFWE